MHHSKTKNAPFLSLASIYLLQTFNYITEQTEAKAIMLITTGIIILHGFLAKKLAQPHKYLYFIQLLALTITPLIYDTKMTAYLHLGAAIVTIVIIKPKLNQLNYLHLIHRINKLTPFEFELFVAEAMKRKGYKVIGDIKQTADYGCDVLVEKRRKRILIEVKKHQKPIGSPTIQKALGALHHHGAEEAIIVSTSGFSKQAENVARTGPAKLWNIKDLLG